MKLSHKQKTKLARKLISKTESSIRGFGIFQSSAWQRREQAIKKRVLKKRTYAESLETL